MSYCPVHGRICESNVRIENGIFRCRLCNRFLLTYPTTIKSSRPKIKRIDLKSTPGLRNYDYALYSGHYTRRPSTLKSNKKTKPDEDSPLVSFFKIIGYLITTLFLLGLMWRLLT